METRRPFDPEAHELDKDFRLTKHTELKGWGCKLPQEDLLKLLKVFDDEGEKQEGAHEGGDGQFVMQMPNFPTGTGPRTGKF